MGANDLSARPTVLVLGGGPDAEREVSIESSGAVADAIRDDGRFDVNHEIVDAITLGSLRSMRGDGIFPVLHGPFGEGGPMQSLLELDGRPYVGSGPGAARLAMDKLAGKVVAGSIGVPTPVGACLNLSDDACPIQLPCVVKPVHEGSSVGLSLCRSEREWDEALASVRADRLANPDRAWMVESLVDGRELTVGVLERGDGLGSVGVVEIEAASGSYDYEAKYQRDDTRYTIDPELPDGASERMQGQAVELCRAMGVRHLARVDFMLDDEGAWLLEVNTMPGFTAHSLLPKLADAQGIGLGPLCRTLVEHAMGEHARVRSE